eukprot:4427720-Pyramimonas_sp.AAC.1
MAQADLHEAGVRVEPRDPVALDHHRHAAPVRGVHPAGWQRGAAGGGPLPVLREALLGRVAVVGGLRWR